MSALTSRWGDPSLPRPPKPERLAKPKGVKYALPCTCCGLPIYWYKARTTAGHGCACGWMASCLFVWHDDDGIYHDKLYCVAHCPCDLHEETRPDVLLGWHIPENLRYPEDG